MPERYASHWWSRPVFVKGAVLGAVLFLLLVLFTPVVVRGPRRPQKVGHTESLIYRVAAGLEMYREDHRVFPPDFVPPGASLRRLTEEDDPPWYPAPAVSPETLYYYLGNPYLSEHTAYVEFRGLLESVDLSGNGLPEVVDAWGSPILYQRCPFPEGTFDDGMSPFHNTGTFDLYSMGSDQQTGSTPLPDPAKDLEGFCRAATDEAADGDGPDDINNW